MLEMVIINILQLELEITHFFPDAENLLFIIVNFVRLDHRIFLIVALCFTNLLWVKIQTMQKYTNAKRNIEEMNIIWFCKICQINNTRLVNGKSTNWFCILLYLDYHQAKNKGNKETRREMIKHMLK